MIGLLGGTACSRYAGFGINNNGININQMVLGQRCQGQNTSGGIAACITNNLGILNLLSVQLCRDL